MGASALDKQSIATLNVKYALEDHKIVDKEVRLINMDWTLIRAVRLQFDDQNSPSKHRNLEIKALNSKGDGMGLTDSVTTSSVARLLVMVAVEGLYIQSAVVVRN